MYHTHKPKDDFRAKEYRDFGTDCYKMKKFSEALEFYNKSLCFAEIGSENLALAYGNRSAVYFEIREFEKCVANIQLARDAGYPIDKLSRLDQREQKCQALNQQRPGDNPKNYFKLSYPPHEKYPNVAECLELRTNKKYGRHVVTNQDLKPGDFIALEESPFKALKKGGTFIRCANCFESNKLSLIPHDSCANAMFCSQECLDYGKDKFMCGADEEFSIIPRIVLEAIDIVGGDLKKLESLTNNADLRSKTVVDLDLSDSSDKNFRYKQLLAFNSLAEYEVDPKAYRDHPILDRWTVERERKIVADFISSVVRRVNNGISAGIMNFWEQSDDGGIYEKSSREGFDFGWSVCLFASFFNHSCSPNVMQMVVDNKLAFYVAIPIKKGEQIFSLYEQISHLPTEQRQEFCLEHYRFKCSCIACEKDWNKHDFPVVDESFEFNKMQFTSVKALKKKFKRNCDYIQKNFKNFPCQEIEALRSDNATLLNLLAGNEQFMFEKIR